MPPDAVRNGGPARDAAREHSADVGRPAEVETPTTRNRAAPSSCARRAVVARCPRDGVRT